MSCVYRQTAAASESEKRARGAKSKRRKSAMRADAKLEHDDMCYRCGEGGELMMCDRVKCPKVYHLRCLKLTKPPHGQYCYGVFKIVNIYGSLQHLVRFLKIPPYSKLGWWCSYITTNKFGCLSLHSIQGGVVMLLGTSYSYEWLCGV